MKLGWLEKLYVNSALRHHIQRPLELRALTAQVPMPHGAHVLDIGCGNGRALIELATRTHALSLTGVDVDPAQIAAARARLSRAKRTAQLVVAGAEHLPLPANVFDIATSFGALHHIPQWQQAVAEASRVLRHGGLFYMLEFYAPLIENPLVQWAMPHPKQRFTHTQLLECLQTQGLTPLYHRSWAGLAGIIVARRTSNPAGYD